MANLNTNIGPERVEVIPVALGSVQVAGASTAVTSFIIRSSKAGAPTDTVETIQSLDDFVALFGDQNDAGQGYWAVKGFYDNAGTGAVALITNASPSSPSGDLITFTSGSGKVRDNGTTAVAFNGTGVAEAGGAGYIRDNDFIMDEDILVGSMLIQRGSSKGSVTVSSVTGSTTLNGSGFLSIDSKVGDIIYDGTSDYLLVEVISNTQAKVDRSGFSTGTRTVYASSTALVLHNKLTSSGTSSFAPSEPASSSGAGFLVLDDNALAPQARNSLNEDILVSGSNEKAISQNIIQAGATVLFANASPTSFTYTPSTGLVQYSGSVNLSLVSVGDVFRDGAGLDFEITVVNDGADNVNIVDRVTGAFPASINTTAGNNAGGSIRNGATRLNLVDSSFNPGTTVNITVFQPATRIEVSASYLGSAASYFLVDPALQDSDYIGTSADGKGLHALDVVDQVNLICIPGVENKAVKAATIDYATNQRSDCMALVAVPSFVTKASTNDLVASVTITSITNGTAASVVQLSTGTNLSQVEPDMVLQIGSDLFTILNVNDADDQLEVDSTSVSTTGAASIRKVSAVTYKDTLVNDPSTKAAWYFNHLVVDNNGSNVTVDPVGHIAGVMARIDSNTLIGGVSHAPAGIQFARIAGTVGLQLSLSERLDGEPLREAFINRLTSFPGAGRVVYGAYTAGGPSVTAEEQLIQVIRSILFVKSSLESGLRGFIWENQSPDTQRRVSEAIASFMRANAYLFPSGLPENQQFRIIEVTPTQTDINVGLLRVRLQVRFNTCVRFIEIDLEFPIPLAS